MRGPGFLLSPPSQERAGDNPLREFHAFVCLRLAVSEQFQTSDNSLLRDRAITVDLHSNCHSTYVYFLLQLCIIRMKKY